MVTTASPAAPAPEHSALDYLPARMLNEFVYCPRLFYYEFVEGQFVHNCETVEGSLRHQKLERKEDALLAADEIEQQDQIHSRSVQLSSETYRLIARLDLLEGVDGQVSPVDYKRGQPRETDEGELQAWDPDRVQVCVQALILRDNGYRCDEAVVYYVATRQRVRVPIDDALVEKTLTAARAAMTLATSPAATIPPPLVDSPKCPRCSLVTICLPDETRFLAEIEPATPEPPTEEVEARPMRRLIPAGDDLKPLYVNTQGFFVGKSGNVLQIKDKGKLVHEVRISDTSQLNLFGNVQVSSQAVQVLCENQVPISYFTMGGWFHGMTQGLNLTNVVLRREQFRKGDDPEFCLAFAKSIVAAKIQNQRTMLMRNHVDRPSRPIAVMKQLIDDADRAADLASLLGIEGYAARLYFENFAGMLKLGQAPDVDSPPAESPAAAVRSGHPDFPFDFEGRNRRPPKDPVNALLSLAYAVLAKDLTIACHAVGFDPYLGFYHQLRFGRAALALDLMEPFRPLIADSAVLSAINTRMITSTDFLRVGPSVALKPSGRKAFFRAYEQRMETEITHPLFQYKVSYRRLLEVQTRLLARWISGEIPQYPPFVTR